MIRSFLVAFIRDCIQALRGKDVRLPEAVAYVKETAPEEVIRNLSDVVTWIKRSPGTLPPRNACMENFFNLLSGALAVGIKEESASKRTWDDLKNRDGEGLMEGAEYFLKTFSSSNLIAIQTPIIPAQELKQEIADRIRKEDPTAILRFSVDKGLLGGMRIFRNGTLRDYSWKRILSSISEKTLENAHI